MNKKGEGMQNIDPEMLILRVIDNIFDDDDVRVWMQTGIKTWVSNGGSIPKAEAQQYSLICKNSQKITFMKP
jgi:hypothetical protein